MEQEEVIASSAQEPREEQEGLLAKVKGLKRSSRISRICYCPREMCYQFVINLEVKVVAIFQGEVQNWLPLLDIHFSF